MITGLDSYRWSTARCAKADPGYRTLPGKNSDERALRAGTNHYQRPGLWIAHSASIITQAIRRHYGLNDPPVRWVVTANWPPLRIGPWRLPSPGDWLLPRVAKTLSCYPVAFSGTNPRATAGLLRRLLRDAQTIDRPIGLFPEGAAGVAGKWSPALPGVGRLMQQLAKLGLPIQPVGISEDDRFVIRFGVAITPEECAERRTRGNSR